MTDVKICGLKTPEALTAAIEGGARFVGFVFYPPSPRFIDLPVAAYLASFVPQTVRIVGLFVNPSDEELEKVLREVRLDMLQLHGSESPGRLMEIKKKFGLPLIKAIKIAAKPDLDCLPGFEASADWILFDTKENKASSDLPGGNGLPFDWTLLQDFCSKNPPQKPWMLAGGLTSENMSAALENLQPDALDVSSGVESALGVKDPEKIKHFLALALNEDWR